MKKSSIPSVILSTLWEIGKITTQAFFNPRYAGKFGYSSNYPGKYEFVSYQSAVSRLKKKNWIAQKDDIYYLTSKGKKEAFFCFLKERGSGKFKLKQPLKWDRKWRIIFFDVPEKKRRYRDELRSMLKTIGFKEFQKSIWIYPYKVPQFLKEILFEENIKQYTRLITTEFIEYDKDLKKMFNL